MMFIIITIYNNNNIIIIIIIIIIKQIDQYKNQKKFETTISLLLNRPIIIVTKAAIKTNSITALNCY